MPCASWQPSCTLATSPLSQQQEHRFPTSQVCKPLNLDVYTNFEHLNMCVYVGGEEGREEEGRGEEGREGEGRGEEGREGEGREEEGRAGGGGRREEEGEKGSRWGL